MHVSLLMVCLSLSQLPDLSMDQRADPCWYRVQRFTSRSFDVGDNQGGSSTKNYCTLMTMFTSFNKNCLTQSMSKVRTRDWVKTALPNPCQRWEHVTGQKLPYPIHVKGENMWLGKNCLTQSMSKVSTRDWVKTAWPNPCQRWEHVTG